jgi:hypothetical protein
MTTKEMINEKFGRDMFQNEPVLIPPKDNVQPKEEVLYQNGQELVKAELPELNTTEDAKNMLLQQMLQPESAESNKSGPPLRSMTFQMV